MSKIVLDNISGGYDLSKINNNFQKLENALNNEVLYRNNTSLEDNTLITDVDVNGVSLYNLPTPTLNSEAIPLGYLNDLLVSGAESIIWKGTWITGTQYQVNNGVSYNGSSYICILAHTSGTFNTDLASNKWSLLAQAGANGAGSGDMLKANNLSDLTNPVSARSNLGLGTMAVENTSNYLANSAIGTTVQGYDANTVKSNISQTFTASQKSGNINDNDGSFDLSGAGNNYTSAPTSAIAITFTNIAANANKSGYIILTNSSNYAYTAHTNTKITTTDLSKIVVSGTYVLPYLCDGTDVLILGAWKKP